MKELVGDLWKVVEQTNWDAICCTANTVVKKNGELVMGKGIAKEFADKYPYLPMQWGKRVEELLPDEPLVLVSLVGEKPYPVYYQTKTHWSAPSSLPLISRSFDRLGTTIATLGWSQVLLPRPGCQNGGLTWKEVRAFLCGTFDVNRYPWSAVTFIGRSYE